MSKIMINEPEPEMAMKQEMGTGDGAKD